MTDDHDAAAVSEPTPEGIEAGARQAAQVVIYVRAQSVWGLSKWFRVGLDDEQLLAVIDALPADRRAELVRAAKRYATPAKWE